jgi:hypothetical protein
VSKGLAVDSACLQKAEDKYTSGWTKAEAKADCFTGGDAEAIEAKVDALLADLNSSLGGPGPSKCTSKKIQAAGRRRPRRPSACRRPPARAAVDAACLQKAEEKYAKASRRRRARTTVSRRPVMRPTSRRASTPSSPISPRS